MNTSEIASEQLHTGPSQSAVRPADSTQTLATRRNTKIKEKDLKQSVIIDKRHFELFHSLPDYSKFNSIAATVRSADAAMQKIETQIDKMKDQILEHVKQYPPYGKASAERVRLLKQFASFRKQIDKLTFPPENYGTMKIIADPSQTGEAGDWEIHLENKEGKQTILHSQQVHSGPKGLNIRELPPDEANDDELYAAVENLESAKKILGRRRNALSSDFQNILDQTLPTE
jgi:hypothetical protein